MHQLDESFKEAKLKRAKRRRRNTVRRLIVSGAALVLIGIGGFVVLEQPLWQGWLGWGPSVPETPEPIEEAGGAPAVYIPAIVDLAGDPMKISLGDDAAVQVTKYLRRPDEVPVDRVNSDVALLMDVMITTSQRFMTTLPSSPKDFALYQSQRMTMTPVVQREPESVPTATEPVDPVEPVAAEPSVDPAAIVEPTSAPAVKIEDTTSVATVRRETQRFSPDGEYIGKVLVDRSLESLMQENRFSGDDAKVFAEALNSLLQRPGLVAGDIVAIHGVRERATSPVLSPVQMSLYNGGSYVGTLSRSDEGTVVRGADPWVYENLFNYSGQEEVAQPGRQYRLLDAIYSTAVRNRVPTGVLGEAIMLLSRSFDLNAFATTDDKLVLAYAKDGEGDNGGIGRVLYVSVQGTDRNMQCYVFKMQVDGDYSCFSENKSGRSVATPPGMVTPVRGVLTTPFGPGMDPVLKKVTVHSGVTWAAPAGTPVLAAFAGKVVSAKDKGDNGKVVQLSHSEKRETFYMHLQDFAPGIAPGKSVKAGDLLGYVGTTGQTAGPSLTFELHVGGDAVDPLATVVPVTSDDDEAVQRLTDRIIHVESGGSATAKNPLSSAYGLGQFINSTWIRMMNTYRPDLARSMNQTDLLALRADPTIAREMVSNLAREGESYLRSRGHSITAGRLYLCHFLGMEGAATVLSADPGLQLVDVLGQSVISANPFLTGHDVAYVIDWAERKMSGKVAPRAPAAPPVPPEFRIYQAAIDRLLLPPDPLTPAPGVPELSGAPPEGDPSAPQVIPNTSIT